MQQAAAYRNVNEVTFPQSLLSWNGKKYWNNPSLSLMLSMYPTPRWPLPLSSGYCNVLLFFGWAEGDALCCSCPSTCGGDPHSLCSCPGFTCDTPGLWEKGQCASLCLRSSAVHGRRMSNRGLALTAHAPCPASHRQERPTLTWPWPKAKSLSRHWLPFWVRLYDQKPPKTPQY